MRRLELRTCPVGQTVLPRAGGARAVAAAARGPGTVNPAATARGRRERRARPRADVNTTTSAGRSLSYEAFVSYLTIGRTQGGDLRSERPHRRRDSPTLIGAALPP